jgi:hypothetical protein
MGILKKLSDEKSLLTPNLYVKWRRRQQQQTNQIKKVMREWDGRRHQETESGSRKILQRIHLVFGNKQ